MRKIFLTAMLVAAAASVFAPAHGFAQRGQRGGGPPEGRPGQGGPPPSVDITSGEAFDISGEVVGMAAPHGIEVETDDGNINLSDLGPAPYWKESGVDFPKAGDKIQATGYVVEIDDTERYIPTAITIDGETIELRDSENGEPLWRMPPPRFEDNNE